MKNKYRNKKTEIDGIVFDSKAEAVRYRELKLLELTGEIVHLELQPRFDIVPSVKWNGKTLRKRVYIADFKYYETQTGRFVVEDVKGMRTQVYTLKRQLFLNQYPEYIFREL